MHLGRVLFAMGLLGAVIALVLLLPLPSSADIYAARRWGVGAGYVGFILGFPVSIVAVPMAIALHPFPIGEDATGAGAMAAIIAIIVAMNWSACTALLVALTRIVRRSNSTARASRLSSRGHR